MRRPTLAMLAATLLIPAALIPGVARAADDDAARAQRWHDLAGALFDGRLPAELPGWVTLDAPARAIDAATVPVTITLAPDKPIKAVYLVVDENPSPLAAHVVFGPSADPRLLTLRVRVDQYSNMHAVVEAEDGSLIGVSRFIKASGGCSAPVGQTPETALRGAGEMKLRATRRDGAMQADLLIRHPNFNGMQMDQITRYYTPARYINSVDVTYNGESVFHMDADISLASDPAIGFRIKSDGHGTLSVAASDTEHAKWRQDFPLQIPGT